MTLMMMPKFSTCNCCTCIYSDKFSVVKDIYFFKGKKGQCNVTTELYYIFARIQIRNDVTDVHTARGRAELG